MTDDRLQARLADLKQEYEVGERRLRELTQQEVVLRETLLRISGAVQVLEELLEPAEPGPAGVAGADGEGRRQPDVMVVP
jgi:predicted nuclease with TOPRIM domain